MPDWEKLAMLPGKAPVKRKRAAAKLPPADPAFSFLDPNDSLSAGLSSFARQPLQWEPVRQGCEFLRFALETGGEEYKEPMWFMTTLCASFLEGGEQLAHQFANKHPGYNEGDDTQEKYDRALNSGVGWPACQTIKDSGSPFCEACPHFVKGKSPLHLTTPIVTEPEQPTVAPVTAETIAAIPELMLPTGYVLSGGFICRVKPVQTPDGQTVNVPEPMFRSVLTNPWISDHPVTLHLTVINGPHTEIAQINVEDASERKIFSTLLAQKIWYTPEGKKYMEPFMTSWMERLYRTLELQQPGRLGWNEDNGIISGFCYNGTVYRPNGQEIQAGMFDTQITKVYTPCGELAPWLRLATSICNRGQYEYEILLATTFAASLLRFTGQASAIMWFWDRGGKGKSSTVHAAMGAWGNPRYRENQKSTIKSIANRLGQIGSLPLYWDDIQDDALDEAIKAAHVICSQIEGGRLDRSINQRERLVWNNMTICCANKSFIDAVTSRKADSGATALRVFEIKIADNPKIDTSVTSTQIDRMASALENNFGRMGVLYSKVLSQHHKKIDQLVYDTVEKFRARVGEITGERMWSAACAAILVGAHLGKKLGVPFHLKELQEELIRQYMYNRQRISGLEIEVSTETLISDFLNAYQDYSIWTSKAMARGGKTKIEVAPGSDNFKHTLVQWCQGNNCVRIHRATFMEYIEKRKGNRSHVLSDMNRYHKAQTAATYRIVLGAGTGNQYMAPGRTPCIEIGIPEVPSTPFEEALQNKLMQFHWSGTGPLMTSADVIPFPVNAEKPA